MVIDKKVSKYNSCPCQFFLSFKFINTVSEASIILSHRITTSSVKLLKYLLFSQAHLLKL